MKIARFANGESPAYGIVDGADLVVLRSDPIFDSYDTTGQRVPLAEARLLSPMIPRSKVVCVGRNYEAHAKELGNTVPEIPAIFLKPNTAVIGPDDPIVLPEYTREASYEAELAVVIGRICKSVPAQRAADVIFGYTAANDMTARDVQRTDVQWTRAKCFDTSCPLGPFIETELDVAAGLAIRSWVDGELRQDGNTADMVWGVGELLEHITGIMTLLPGDVVLTGTPAGVGSVREGQRIEIEVEGIGRFANPVVRR